MRKWGVFLSDKDVSGSFGDKEIVKDRGSLVKVGKNGGLSVKASKKSRAFLVAHGA